MLVKIPVRAAALLLVSHDFRLDTIVLAGHSI